MSKLGDVFGDDFEKEYQQKEQMREQKRRKIGKEDMMEACWNAVHGEGFDGEEPRFTFDAGEVEYDVLLMQAPENNMDNFIYPFGDDGKTLGMFHVGELFSCAFLGDMKQLIGKVEESEHYIVVGKYEENSKGGEQYFNINPVAGITPIGQAKKYADKVDDEYSGSTVEEQSEQHTEDELELTEEDETSEAAKEDVLKVFKLVSNKKEAVMRSVSDGDDDALTKLTKLVDKNIDGDVDEDYIAEIYIDEVDDIDGRGEEDDDMDLDMGDDEDEFDLSEDSDEADEGNETTEETTESSSESEGGDDVEDWF